MHGGTKALQYIEGSLEKFCTRLVHIWPAVHYSPAYTAIRLRQLQAIATKQLPDNCNRRSGCKLLNSLKKENQLDAKGHETFNKTFLNEVDLIFGSTNLIIWFCHPPNQPNELLSNCNSLFTFDRTLFTDLAPRKIQSISRNVCAGVKKQKK